MPFSGKIFKLDWEEVQSVRVVNGRTGYMVYLEKEEMEKAIELLNSLRYQYWVPNPPIARGGYRYALWLEMDGEKVPFQFTPESILVRGLWYHCKEPALDRLVDTVILID